MRKRGVKLIHYSVGVFITLDSNSFSWSLLIMTENGFGAGVARQDARIDKRQSSSANITEAAAAANDHS